MWALNLRLNHHFWNILRGFRKSIAIPVFHQLCISLTHRDRTITLSPQKTNLGIFLWRATGQRNRNINLNKSQWKNVFQKWRYSSTLPESSQNYPTLRTCILATPHNVGSRKQDSGNLCSIVGSTSQLTTSFAPVLHEYYRKVLK